MNVEPELGHGQMGVFLEGRDQHGVEDVPRRRRVPWGECFEYMQRDGNLAPAIAVGVEVIFADLHLEIAAVVTTRFAGEQHDL